MNGGRASSRLTGTGNRWEITIDGFHDDIVPPGAAERDAAARLPFDLPGLKSTLGLTRLDETADRPFYDQLCFYPTLTINGLHGCYAGPGTKTVPPNEAFAKCDIRLIDAQRPTDILAKVETPIDSPFAAPLRRAILSARGVEPLLYPAGFGSLPGYAFTNILGIPAFVTNYANADAANHAPNEDLTLDYFYNGVRTGPALLDALSRP